MKELIEAINRLAAAQEESNKISKLLTVSVQSMLHTPIPCMNILGKFDRETQIKMLENSLSDNELKELAESRGETVETVKKAVEEYKYLFNL
jgi:hypothetical protein